MASAAAAAVTLPAEAAPAVLGCGKQCMGPCCLPGSTLPLYCFPPRPTVGPSEWARRVRSWGSMTNLSSCSSSNTIALEDSTSGSGDSTASDSGSEGVEGEGKRSFLDSLIISLWDERAEEGLFRYDVQACETKVIPGQLGLVAQYNEGRHSKKRPTEFSMDAVMQPFDPKKFNFNKVGQREALFAFEEAPDIPELAPNVPGSAVYHEDAVVAAGSGGPNVVAINVSPIEYGHVLLIPRIHSQYAQRMDAASLLLAVQFAKEVDNPCFRLGYNSLGAFGTVNHLHFQGYYLQRPFAIELAPVSAPLWGPKKGVSTVISELEGYPVRGLVYQVGTNPKETADIAGAACEVLQTKNMPYNLFISGCGSKVFLFPQSYAERQAKGEVEADLLDTQVNPAVFEISGHMIMKRREDFEGMTEDQAVRLLTAASLDAPRFTQVKEMCFHAAEVSTSLM